MQPKLGTEQSIFKTTQVVVSFANQFLAIQFSLTAVC